MTNESWYPGNLAVSEIFGPTLQGEGRNIGMSCFFLRFAGCNLKCSWCDTKYTWDWEHYKKEDEIIKMNAEAIYNRLKDLAKGTGHKIQALVVTGGEPLLQQGMWRQVTEVLIREGWWVEVETAGTIAPLTGTEYVSQFTVSPKLANSGNIPAKRYQPQALNAFMNTGKAVFKFVVTSVQDFEEVHKLVDAHDLSPVYIMPEGTTAENLQKVTELIVPTVIEKGYNFTPRLQVELWGQKRGV